jgi:hypothetical protein
MTDLGGGRVKTLGLMSVDDVVLVSVAMADWQRPVLCQAFTACKNGPTPRIAITRFMLYARTCISSRY